jgi:hypothetical protein
LRTFPAAAAPPALAGAVMRRIRALAPMPRFRLRWIDYAVGLVATGTAALALIFWRLIPAQVMQSARYRAAFLLEQYSQTAAWPALVGGLAFAALALAGIAGLWLVAVSMRPPRTQ